LSHIFLYLFGCADGGVVSFPLLCAYEGTNDFYLVSHVEDAVFGFGYDFVMAGDAAHQTFQIFEFHEIVSLVDGFVLLYAIFLFFQFCVTFEVDFLCDVVFLSGELFHS
jgi:hypothetical protein